MIRLIKTYLTGIVLLFVTINLQSQSAIFSMVNTSANNGQNFCVDVTAQNLTTVLSMQFSINWDPNVIQFTSLNNVYAGFAGANIMTTGSGSGEITFSWFDGTGMGVTMPANEVLFELCFTVTGNPGDVTNIDFTDTPTVIEVVTLISGGQNIGIVTQGGEVSIPSGQPPLIYNLPNEIVSPSATFCLPVTVEDFDDILSMQFSINWDPTVLQFDSVTALNIPGLEVTDFGVTGAASGVITFSWFDDTSSGVTLPDNTVVFELCFSVVGVSGDVTTVAFNDNPVPAEIIEAILETDIGMVHNGGTITVQEVIFVTNTNITEANCYDMEGGAIDISVAGGTSPYIFAWSNGATMEDIDNLSAGSYTVTILDSDNPTNITVQTFDVPGNFTPPVAAAGPDTMISCTNPTVELDGTGSTTGTDIVYLWTTNGGGTILNETTLTPTVNTVGLYVLTATDTLNGCSTSDLVVVSGLVVPPIVDAGEPEELDCQITVATLSASVNPPGGSYTFQWTSPTGNIVNGAMTTSALVNEAGMYYFTVMESGTGCSATDSVLVTLNNDTPIANAGPTMQLDCGNAEVMLDGTGSSSGSNITYAWTWTVGNISSGEMTATPTVDVAGTFTLEVTNTESHCTATSMVEVVQDLTSPTAVVDPNGGEINCTVNTVILDGTGSSSGTNFSYQWNTTNGNFVNGQNTLNPEVDAEGTYELVVTDTTNQCTATATTEVTEDANIPIADAGENKTIDCTISQVTLDGSDRH